MNLEDMVFNCFDKLTSTDKEIWRYIWSDRKACEQKSIAEIAQACSVSPGAVTRFTKKLGLEGYTEFKLALRWQNNAVDAVPLNLQNKLDQDYRQTLEMLKTRDFSPMFEILDRCERIFAFGTGEVQHHAVQEFKRLFLYMGRHTVFVVDDETELNMTLRLMNEKDAFLAVSLSGENAETNKIVRQIKDKGIPIMAITGYDDSTLAKMSDFHLPFYHHIMLRSPWESHDHYSCSTVFLVVESMLAEYLQFLQLT